MIGRRHRFHGRKALNVVYKKGQTLREPMVNLRWAPRPAGKPYRVAVVVSRKVSKSAVTRNRIRRRIYAAVHGMDKDVRPGMDLVFTVFSDKVASIPADELRATVAELLLKSDKAKAESVPEHR